MRFSVRRAQEADLVALVAAMAEAVDAGAVLGLDVAGEAAGAEQLCANAARLFCGEMMEAVAGHAGVLARAALARAVDAGAALGEAVRGAALLGLNLHMAQAMAETMRAAAYVGARAWLDWGAEALWGAAARLGRNVPAGRMAMDEAFGAQVARESFVLEEAYFDVVLAPGSVLVADSGGYAVLLDGQDVMAAQRGDWLWLDRDVYDVRVEVAQGEAQALDVTGTWVVRWL